jgi:hypothetical protein
VKPAARHLAAAALGAALLVACSEPPPSWDKLVAARIAGQYPAYVVKESGPGQLLVQRPGLADKPVDVAGIAQFCQRGVKDCNYAMDQMLLELQASK